MKQLILKKAMCCAAALISFLTVAYADDWYSDQLANLPAPQVTYTPNQKMSMRDAIMLALRNNPNVEAAELQRVADKFSLMQAYNNFFPQYSLNAGSTMNKGQGVTYNVNPGVSVNTPIGTNIDFGYSNDFSGGPGVKTVKITQPLLRGFGFLYTTYALQNAKDDELVSQLNYKKDIIDSVTSVIQNYRQVVQDYNTYQIQKETLKQNEELYKQDLIRVKAGTMSRSDLIEAKATLATFRLSVVQTENSLEQNKKTLLTSLGLAPTVKFRIERNIDLPASYKAPSENYAIAQALAGNIPYQSALIKLRETERTLKKDKLDLLPKLDMTINNSWGWNATPVSDNSPNFAFDFTMPINDLSTKGKILNDRISLINAKNNLAQQKRTLVSTITQQVEDIANQIEQVSIANEQVSLQKKTVENTQMKIKYGKSAMFELTTQQNTLLTNQTSLVGAKITLLNQVTTLNADLALTLKVWGIKLKY